MPKQMMAIYEKLNERIHYLSQVFEPHSSWTHPGEEVGVTVVAVRILHGA